MGLGSFLSKLSRGIEDYRYSRDFGSNYKQDFQAQQDYLNRMAAEREADKELKRRQVEEDRAWRKQDRDERREEAKARRLGTGLELMVGTATKDEKGQWKLPTATVGRQLKLEPEEAAELELLARGRLAAKDQAEAQAAAARNAASARDFGEQLQLEKERIALREASDAKARERDLADKLVLGGLAPLLALGKPQTRSGASTWMEQADLLLPDGASWQQKVDLARELEERWRTGAGGGAPGPLPGPVVTPLGGSRREAAGPQAPGSPRVLVRRSNLGNVQHSLDGGATWRPGPPA